jgi:hypothetical protein
MSTSQNYAVSQQAGFIGGPNLSTGSKITLGGGVAASSAGDAYGETELFCQLIRFLSTGTYHPNLTSYMRSGSEGDVSHQAKYAMKVRLTSNPRKFSWGKLTILERNIQLS